MAAPNAPHVGGTLLNQALTPAHTPLPDVMVRQLDGREVAVLDGKRTLATAGLAIERIEPDWRNRVLAALANPQVALILMMIGIYGLFFEFTSPGFGVPGVAGAISLLVALYAFQLLPVNWAGVLLLAVGAGLMLALGSCVFMPRAGITFRLTSTKNTRRNIITSIIGINSMCALRFFGSSQVLIPLPRY